MLIVTPVGAAAGRYFVDGPPGRWVGQGAADLGLAGTLTPGQLESVLAGRTPEGADLLEHRRPGRRAGWDLILAAPKSLSLLGALAPPDAASSIDAAQTAAVEDALGYLERRASCHRDGKEVPAIGLLGAAFEHRSSSAGEPHFHTHVLIANLGGCADGSWSALHSNSIWPHQRAMGAVFELALRERMRSAGWDLEWRLSAGGLPDLAAVPRAAAEATSSRHARIAEGLGDLEAPSRGARTAAKHLTRDEISDPGWRDQATRAGFGAAEAAELTARAWGRELAHVAPSPAGRAERAEAWLLERGSTFSSGEAIRALAATDPVGASPGSAERFAADLCRASEPVREGRWTTRSAAALDRALLASAESRRGCGAGLVTPDVIEATLADRPYLGPLGAALSHRLTTSGHGVEVVAGSPGKETFVQMALALEAARAAWEAAGHVVAVVGGPHERMRWDALSGAGADPSAGPTPSVLVVDQADRQPTPRLAATLDFARRFAAKVVLVEGGTLPRRHHVLSEGLASIGDTIGRSNVDPGLPTMASFRQGARGLPGGPGAAEALRHLLDSWAERTPERPTWLVGLGRAEAEALGRWAREQLVALGEVTGPEVEVRGRPFATGDRVVALRQSAVGSPRGPTQECTVAAGTVGRVVCADPQRSWISVDWGGRTGVMDRLMARHLGHAYATTPGMLHLVEGEGLLLGDRLALRTQRGRIVEAAVVAPRLRERGLGLDEPGRARWGPSPHLGKVPSLGKDLGLGLG